MLGVLLGSGAEPVAAEVAVLVSTADGSAEAEEPGVDELFVGLATLLVDSKTNRVEPEVGGTTLVARSTSGHRSKNLRVMLS